MKVELDDLITQTEAAKLRGVSLQSINELVKRGKLKTITLGRRRFLSRKQVVKYKPAPAGRPKGKRTAKKSAAKKSK